MEGAKGRAYILLNRALTISAKPAWLDIFGGIERASAIYKIKTNLRIYAETREMPAAASPPEGISVKW